MNVLVTGATGFLGKKICFQLKENGENVIGVGRNLLQGKKLQDQQIIFENCDFKNESKLEQIIKSHSITAIIHSGALSSPWGKREDFIHTNVNGTKNLIKLSKKFSIKSFVYISTPSVYFDFKDRFNIKESDYIASPSASTYTETKLMAEKLIIKATGSNFNTIILRPRGLFGPEDTSIIPRLLKAYNKNRLPIIGDSKNIVDITYIDNVVNASLLALEKCEQCSGEIFNITNDEPVNLWMFVSKLLYKLDLPFHPRKVPYKVIYLYAFLSELISKIFFAGKMEPNLTRYTASLLAKSQTLDISKAKRLLGYSPKINLNDGLDRYVKWYRSEGNNDY